MFGLSALEAKLAGAALAITLFAGWLAWHDHNIRTTLTAQIAAATKRADDALNAQVLAESKRDQGVADAQHAGAQTAQDAINAYILAHPIEPGSVRLCRYPNSAGRGSGASSGQGGPGTTNPAAGSPGLPNVLAVDDGPDLSGGIDAIVSAAEELGIVYRERLNIKTSVATDPVTPAPPSAHP